MHTKARIIVWGVLLALTVAAAVWAVGHFSGGYQKFFMLAGTIGAGQWLVLAAATALFYALDYARLYTLFALLGIRIGPATGLRLTCVTYFVSSLTPVAELNIPAMIFMLRRDGIAASKTAAVALVKALYMTLWVCVFGFAGLFLQKDLLPAAIAENIVLLAAPAMLLLATFFYVIFAPERVLDRTTAWLANESLSGWRRAFVGGLHRCVTAVSEIGQSTRALHFASHAACIAFLFVYIFIGAYLCHALGLAMPVERAIPAFSESLFVAYLAPVPGAIGVTEVLTSYLIDPAMTDKGMVAASLLRFLCAYVLVIPGALILLDAIRVVGWRHFRKRHGQP